MPQERLTWLADELRAAGLTVVEIDGWKTRSRPESTGGFKPVGVLWHHTGSFDKIADAADDKAYATWLAKTGRSDLPAPLCHLSISREGVVYVCAAGRANHAGVAKASGSVASGDGNSLYVGIECMNDGTQGWDKAQYAAMVKVGAVLGRELPCTAAAQRGHKETSVTGKWDPGALDMNRFRRDIDAAAAAAHPALKAAYHWHQPGELGSAESGVVLGVRKSFGAFKHPSVVVGSRATAEGDGIRARSILRARVTTVAPRKPLSFAVAAGHAPPPRAPKAGAVFMKAFAKVPARFKGGDMNLSGRVAARLTGRRVVGDGVLWLTIPRVGWKVLSTQAVAVGGDHKAVLARVRHRKTGVTVRILVINAMSVSAPATKASDIFAAGLALRPHIVMGSECSDFRAVTVDANTKETR